MSGQKRYKQKWRTNNNDNNKTTTTIIDDHNNETIWIQIYLNIYIIQNRSNQQQMLGKRRDVFNRYGSLISRTNSINVRGKMSIYVSIGECLLVQRVDKHNVRCNNNTKYWTDCFLTLSLDNIEKCLICDDCAVYIHTERNTIAVWFINFA